MIIEPNFGHLSNISAEMPHPKGGFINVNLIKNDSNKVQGSITLPQSVSGKFLWKGEEINLHEGINKIQ